MFTKKQVTCKDKMTSVNIYYLWLKCYIYLINKYNVVPKRMGSYKRLANAIKEK